MQSLTSQKTRVTQTASRACTELKSVKSLCLFHGWRVPFVKQWYYYYNYYNLRMLEYFNNQPNNAYQKTGWFCSHVMIIILFCFSIIRKRVEECSERCLYITRFRYARCYTFHQISLFRAQLVLVEDVKFLNYLYDLNKLN